MLIKLKTAQKEQEETLDEKINISPVGWHK